MSLDRTDASPADTAIWRGPILNCKVGALAALRLGQALDLGDPHFGDDALNCCAALPCAASYGNENKLEAVGGHEKETPSGVALSNTPPVNVFAGSGLLKPRLAELIALAMAEALIVNATALSSSSA